MADEHPADLLARGEDDEATIKEAHTLLLDAMLAVQSEAGDLKLVKSSEGAERGQKKDKYLDLGQLTAETRPLLNKHGLVWQTFPTTLLDEGAQKPALRYRLTHVASKQTQEDTMLLMLDKPTSQGQGAALTYARRQARQAVLDVVAEEDTDGQSASRRPTGDARPLPAASRRKMLAEIEASGKDLGVLLGAVGLEGIEACTVGDAKAIKGLL